MGEIHHIRDEHGKVTRLIPWHVNGTLDESEDALVRAHCESCAECRADLQRERLLHDEIAGLPVGADIGWATLREKVLNAPPPSRRDAGRILRRPIALGWALAAQIVIAVGIALAFLAAFPPGSEDGYRLLSSERENSAGNVIVLFAPGTMEADLRQTLSTVDARIVDGPTASGAYVLRVDVGRQAQTLERLRQSSQIILAEPISADTGP